MWLRYFLLCTLAVPLLAMVSSSQTSEPQLKVRHVHLRVQDVERTKTFYRDKLGLKVTSERPGEVVEFAEGQLWFGKWQGSGEFPAEFITIGLDADSVQAAYEIMRQRGLNIPDPPKESRFGWSFSLRDPDGYRVVVEGER